MSFNNQLGSYIKKLRLQQGLTQSQLAENICSKQYIYLLEKGSRVPSSYMLALISEKLNTHIPINSLLFNTTHDQSTDDDKKKILFEKAIQSLKDNTNPSTTLNLVHQALSLSYACTDILSLICLQLTDQDLYLLQCKALAHLQLGHKLNALNLCLNILEYCFAMDINKKSPSIYFESLFLTAYMYDQVHLYPEAIKFLDYLISEMIEMQDPHNLGAVLYLKGLLCLRTHRLSSSHNYIYLALILLQSNE